MAFRDQIRKYKLGTGMAQTSSEELQSLSDKAERSIAPSSPMESSVIGASPDAAKMAGTPAQKTSSLRLAIQQDKNLPDQQRTNQPRQQLTAEEQASGQKGQKVQSLNSLNERVQNLTKGMLQQAAQQTNQAQLQVNPEALSGITAENQPEATQLLNKLGTNQATNQDILRLNQLMNRTSISNQLTADQIKANFMSAGASAGQTLASNTADQILVSDINPVELGFQDTNELASILGIPPEELAGLSLKDLQDQAQTLFNDEFNKVGALEQQANDINLGPAERAEARKQLKDMGAVGVRKSENQIDKLADQVANADTVTFAGEKLEVKDVLSDEYLSGLAAKYVDSEDTDPFKEELRESEPELAKWLDDNKEILKQATADLDSDVKAFSDLQFQNQKLKTFSDLPNLSDDVMKTILPDWGELRVDAYNPDEVPALKYLSDVSVPQQQRANVRNSFDQFSQSAPELVPQLARLSPQQLEQLGATSGAGNPKWQAVQSYLKDVSNLNSVDANNPDTVAAFVLGPGKTFQDLIDTARGSQARSHSGLFGSSPIDSELQTVLNSGNPEQIAEFLKTKFAKPDNIANLVNGTPFSASQAGQNANMYNSQTNDLFKITEKYFSDHDRLTRADVADLASSPLDLEKVYASSLKDRMDGPAKENTQRLFEEHYAPQYDDKLVKSKLFSVPKLDSLMKRRVGALEGDDVMTMKDTLENMKAELKAMTRSSNPLQYNYLKSQVTDMEDRVNAHYDNYIENLQALLAVSAEPKDVVKQLENILNHSSGGSVVPVTRNVLKALGIDDEKTLRNIANVMGSKNLGYLEAANRLDLAGNTINEVTRLVNKWAGGDAAKKAADTIGRAGGKVSDTYQSITGGGGGCFLATERFKLADGSSKMIMDITPADELLSGGQTYCTAQFICHEMYEYNLIKVAGSHAVLEGHEWIRVRDSKYSKRLYELDGSMVYVVWNEFHRMIHENSTVFTDYAETDATNERIVEMKNITELNNNVRQIL